MDQASPEPSEQKPSEETGHVLEVTANVADQPESNDNISFAQVTKELDILNKEGQTRLYTGPYGRIISPFKKFSSFTSQRGVKRSPRKLPTPHSKRARLKTDFDLLATDSESSESDTSPDSVTPEKVMDNPAEVPGPSFDPQPSTQMIDEETDDSDSEDDRWQIMEESETEIDKELDEKSDKYSLSAINVKSIIHKIVTNEKVVEMVRRAVLEQVEEKKQEYEPKMTRSKAKKAMEKHEDVPHPLGLSPSKKAQDKSKFLEIDLPEDEEDDEDFNPDKIQDTHGSEDDSESVLSSGYSDCETSSLPSTPSTPVGQQALVIKGSKTPTNPETDNSNSFLSPMGPPLQSFVPRSQHKSSSLGQKYRDAIEKDEKAKREEEELIASRTRSKCPLNKVSLFDLEATFVAPDITEDMYDTTCDDKDWNDFLKTLIVFDNNVTEDTNEGVGEEEDPEFDFLQEAEHAEYDQEDFRNDRAVKVSKKELNLLIDELNEAYYEDDPIDVKSKKVIKAQTETIVVANSQKRQTEAPENLVYDVADKERRQIADQLRQHVQLLTQSFVLGMGDPEEHENIVDATKMFLTELKSFADKSELMCPNTMLKVCNLEPALSVITDTIWKSNVELSADETDRLDRLKFRYENQEVPRLNYKQMKILWTSPVFMYPELLPHGGFYKLNEVKKDRSRIKFIEPEDNLLAMGMDQFSHLPNGKEYINTFMLPCKAKKQIMIRIKNLSAKTAKNNAVKYWKEHKKLPVFPQSAPFFKPEQMKACKDRDISLVEFPSWAAFFRPEDAALGSNMSDLRPSKKYRCLNLTADPDDKSLSILSEETNSTPDSTHPNTDSSNVASSGSSGNSMCKVLAKNRPKKLTRKRLDLDKGNRRTIPAFIPLSFSGLIKSSNSNLSIISASNNMSKDSSKLTQLFHQSMSAVNIATTSINKMQSLPSVRVVDSLSSIQSAEVLKNDVSMSDGNIGTSIPVSFVLANDNTSVHNSPSSNITSVVSGVSCSGGSHDSGDFGTTVNKRTTISSVTNDVDNGEEDTSADVCKSTVDSMPLLIATVDPAQKQSKSQATVVTTSGVMDKTVQKIVLSPLLNSNNSAVQTLQCTSNQTGPSVSSRASPSFSRNPVGVSDDNGLTPDPISTCSTPQKGTGSMMSPMSDVSGSPKTALEIIASYAPYLLSPSANRDQQKLQETTPKKRSEFIKLAPKPTPPGFSLSPTVSIHVPKVKSSPKRKMLNRQAKAILPKGFIVRSFDVSPSKKAASSLIEKAKHPGRISKSQSFYFNSSGRYCKILPQPSSSNQSEYVSTMKCGKTETLGHIGSSRSTNKKASRSASRSCRSSNADKAAIDDDKENIEVTVKDKAEDGQNVDMEVDDDDDKVVDTESDYTQSEDGNETQEELDSQEEVDSQEDDDSHIANLMQASTTTRFDPSKDDASKAHLGKKDRDRDTTLAMLAPDVISKDPQRDVRDTAFAQAYLHKVKKTLRDDMDSLEKFLQLMYNFSKAKESPIKLYMELRVLFQDYPGLLHDFAGFLLQEQAIECGCYDAFEEFNSARSFLRKIELHFSKTPYHFQRIIKTFSRWYRKSGRSTKDLKNEIEPMLKGHKYLLEEFSKFFPAEPPPYSMMDEFEEINLEGSDDELKYDSFEEIELFEGEEVLGTKRCTCTCHQSKDETYRKKKKHCYRCCLTVIDGELVYRVNKSTIKKINITFGPPMKASSLLILDTDENENTAKTAKGYNMKALETDTEVGKESDVGENLIQVDREPTDTDSGCVIDSDGLEKEVVPGGCVRVEESKESDKLTSTLGASSYQSVVTDINASSDGGEEVQLSSSLRKESDITASECLQSHSDKMANTVNSVKNGKADGSVIVTDDQLTLDNNRKSNTDQNSEATSSKFNNSRNVTDKCESEPLKLKSKHINDKPKIVSDISNASHSSSDTALANDILAAAFNAALTSDVSLDNIFPFPLATQYDQGKPKAVLSTGVHEVFDQDSSLVADNEKLLKKSHENINLGQEPKPTAKQSNTSAPTLLKEATVQSQLNFSSDSKVEPAAGDTVVVTSDSIRQTGEVDSVQVFSPFSPFGQEIQSITNAKSPAPYKVPSVSKVRRITPIPVKKGSSGDESFQSVVQNSPVITDMIQSPLGQIVLEKFTDDSNSSKVGKATSEETNKLLPIPFTEFGSNSAKSSDSLSQKSADTEISSQKSDSGSGTVSSRNAADSSTAHALKISQPAIFSEDANVGFTGTSEYISAHISDDSLLHCLGKPAHFNDTIGTVSNLTNILNALDDKSLHFKSQEALEGKADNEEPNSNHGKSDSTTNVISSNIGEQTEKDKTEESGGDTLQEANAATKTFMDKGEVDNEMITVSLLQSCDSSDSGKKTDSHYIPQSIQSIENLERIKSGLFRVTSLSDSESSLTQSNSITQIHVVSNKDGMPSNKNNLEKQRVEFNDVTADFQDSTLVLEQQKMIDEVHDRTCEQGNSVREADRDSDHADKPEKEICPETSDKVIVTEHFHEPQKGTSVQEEPNSNVCNTQIESITISKVCKTSVDKMKDKPPSFDQNKTTPTASVTRENIRNDPENKADSTKAGAHSTESVKDQSLSDHDRSKQEIRRKRKKAEKGNPDISSKKSKKKKKKEQKTEGMVDSPDVSSQDSETGTDHYVQLKEKEPTSSSSLSVPQETDKVSGCESSVVGPVSVLSPGLISTTSSGQGSPASPSQMSADVHSPGLSSSSHDGSTKDDLVWTKETDKIILEKCKSHGIKERTFVKIAKKLGNVTPKQVRKRFSHLYQLIFGSQFSSEDGKGTSSS